MYQFNNAYEAISRFMDQGGDVLWLIAALTFAMWMLIFERIWYFRFDLKEEIAGVITIWESAVSVSPGVHNKFVVL